MKGFGIEVKNNLLDPKHIRAMEASVWLYMWLLDKMTSISEEGVGLILGGKPVKFEDVVEDLGVSRRTYVRWIKTLVEHEYINVLRTPYGISFSVNKAHKRFGNRSAIRDTSSCATTAKVDAPLVTHRITDRGTSNKTEQKDNTVDRTTIGVPFDLFWEKYPIKVSKKKSEQIWNRLPESSKKVIVEDVEKRKLSDPWKRGFIPHPTTYLNGERWNDEIITKSPMSGRTVAVDRFS